MKQLTTRSQISLYCKVELGMLRADMFSNKELCKILNLKELNDSLTNKKAFYLLKEFCISEYFDKWNLKYKAKLHKEHKTKHSNLFYNSNEWKALRYKVLVAAMGKCECCGASSKSAAVLHVDHIKPRSKFPELALEFSNMQVLCEMCNIGKSNKDDTDWRENPYSDYNINTFLQSI